MQSFYIQFSTHSFFVKVFIAVTNFLLPRSCHLGESIYARAQKGRVNYLGTSNSNHDKRFISYVKNIFVTNHLTNLPQVLILMRLRAFANFSLAVRAECYRDRQCTLISLHHIPSTCRLLIYVEIIIAKYIPLDNIARRNCPR